MSTLDDIDQRQAMLRIFDVSRLGTIRYQYDRGDDAEVAVIIPVYNYKCTVIEALQSVVRQDLHKLAVSVIDDCSDDGSSDEIAKFLASEVPRFTRATIIRHNSNEGLATSRNSGITWSREPYLFMLDADNRIRRPALSRLFTALRCSGADFAYSQTSKFGEKIGIGAADIWSPSRLTSGNYIDAMALIRRGALLAVGGYHVSAAQQGWEDYDLWCRFAERGFQGIFVPELLCEYRVHKMSMLNKETNCSTESLMAEMMLRHPDLFNRVSPS